MKWYDITDPADPLLDQLAAEYKLHPLHIEDCRHRNQAAKVETQDSYIFVVLKPVQFDSEGELVVGDLDIFIGPNYVIVVEETSCGPVRSVLERVGQNGSLRPDQAFYRIADGLVDTYYPVIDSLSDELDRIEDVVITCPEPNVLEKLFGVRRTLVELRRIMANSRDVMAHLLRTEYPQISPELRPFLRDVYDHITRNLDNIEIQRDIATGTTELYLTSVANQTNQVMKVLTIFGTIATPALVITGVYGMNLKHLPFADHPHSWGIVSGMIATVSILMLLVFRKMKWI